MRPMEGAHLLALSPLDESTLYVATRTRIVALETVWGKETHVSAAVERGSPLPLLALCSNNEQLCELQQSDNREQLCEPPGKFWFCKASWRRSGYGGCNWNWCAEGIMIHMLRQNCKDARTLVGGWWWVEGMQMEGSEKLQQFTSQASALCLAMWPGIAQQHVS